MDQSNLKHAIANNIYSLGIKPAKKCGYYTRSLDSLKFIDIGSDYILINLVVDVKTKQPSLYDDFKQAHEYYKSRDMKLGGLVVLADENTDDFHKFLTDEYKMTMVDKPKLCALNLNDFNEAEFTIPDNIEIREVKSQDDIKLWSDLTSEAFLGQASKGSIHFANTVAKHDDIKMYIANVNGNPAGGSMLYIGEKDLAGHYCLGVLEKYRKSGAGTSLAVHMINEAKKLGFEYVGAQLLGPSQSLYKKFGFKEYGEFCYYC